MDVIGKTWLMLQMLMAHWADIREARPLSSGRLPFCRYAAKLFGTGAFQRGTKTGTQVREARSRLEALEKALAAAAAAAADPGVPEEARREAEEGAARSLRLVARYHGALGQLARCFKLSA